VPLSVRSGGELGPHLKQCAWPSPRHLDHTSRLSIISIGQKVGEGLLCPFWGVGSLSNTYVAWAEAYLCTKWHSDPSSHFATVDVGSGLYGRCVRKFRNWGCCCASFRGRAGSPSIPPYQVTIGPIRCTSCQRVMTDVHVAVAKRLYGSR